MEFKVKSIIAEIPTTFQDSAGKTVNYTKTRFMSEDDTSVYETGSKIAVGDVFEGEVTKEYQGIKTVKKAQKPAFGGAKFQENPERQMSIERQNSLTNALAFCTAKAQALFNVNKPEKAMEELSGKHIIQVATFFAKYNAGTVKASMTEEEVADLFRPADVEAAKEVFEGAAEAPKKTVKKAETVVTASEDEAPEDPGF